MARAQASWVQLEITVVPRAWISWARFDISGDLKFGSDQGAGTDTGVRVTKTTTQLPVTDSGVGTERSSLGVSGGALIRVATDRAFGFDRRSAAGLTFLFRDGELPARVGTTSATKHPTDTATGTDTSTLLVRDRAVAGSDQGVGVDTRFLAFTSISFTTHEQGFGADNSLVIPKSTVELPEVIFEVAFASDPVDENQIYTVVSSDADGKQLEFVTKRGRQDELKEPETGTLITELFNQDRTFDPSYTQSPYYPDILPGKQARLRANRGSVPYYLFTGDVEQWPQRLDNRLAKSVIQADDGFDALSQIEIEITRPQETTGERIKAILDAASWPQSMRSIDTGQTVLHANTYSGSALQLIRNVVADEDGYFFMTGLGVARFIERHARFKPPYTTPILTLSNRVSGNTLPLTDYDHQVDRYFIKNQVTVSVEAAVDSAGTTVTEDYKITVTDPVSEAKYRPRTLEYNPSAIANQNEVQTKAEYHLDRLRNPVDRIKSVTIEPQMDVRLWQHALEREIGDRIAVEAHPVQTGPEEVLNFEGIIEYVEHRYVVGRWTTTWYLSPADLNDYWILGDAVLGALGSTARLGF